MLLIEQSLVSLCEKEATGKGGGKGEGGTKADLEEAEHRARTRADPEAIEEEEGEESI